MSGLVKRNENVVYLNIKEGKLVTKKNGEVETFNGVKGIITKAEIVKDEYEGKEYEKACLTINHSGDTYILQMRVDSGYFRNFCNAMKNGKPDKEVYIQPSFKKDESGKSQVGCFVSQGGVFLKHAHTKDRPGDLPQLETVTFKGKTQYDNSKQLAYWKNWLLSTFGGGSTAPAASEEETDLPF
jgi:hypothetical protein